MKQVTPATLAAALQTLWRMRKGNGSFVWDLPVPPDEQTAKALYAALPDQPDALREALIRALAQIEQFQDPNVEPGGWWDQRIEPLYRAALAQQPTPAEGA